MSNNTHECFSQERQSGFDLFPSPEDHEIVEQNPPAFVWLRHKNDAQYRICIRDATEKEIINKECAQNFSLLDQELTIGTYSWNIYSDDEERGWQSFSIADNAITFLPPSAADVLASLPKERPRHIFLNEDHDSIHQRCANNISALQNTIDMAIKQGLPPRPQFHLQEDWQLPYREAFGLHRDYFDRNLVACALGHRLLADKDPQRAEQARIYLKDCLLEICSWNPAGPCSQIGGWGDEFGLSHARCLPAVFDWSYDILSEQEREFVARSIEQYALQCEERLEACDFINSPGDSHVGRIPAYLGEAALVLSGTHVDAATCQRWLQKAIDIYASLFPFFGGRDGGWAEGVFYGSSYTKWYLPFFLAIERVHGFSFLNRPFFHKVAQFFMHCAPPGWEIHPFSDGYWCASEDEEWPGFMAQNPFRVYAERFGPELAQEFDAIQSQQEHLQLHLLDVFTAEAQKPAQSLAGKTTNTRCFRDAGIVSMHSNIHDPQNDVTVLARASKFGSVSHQHADQGSFAIIANGSCLISPSGYFGATCGSQHHQEWTNQTQAHNCLLINGEGQESFSHTAIGKIISCAEQGPTATSILDLSEAYTAVSSYHRKIHFDYSADDRYEIIIEDNLTLKEEHNIQFLLHALSEPTQKNNIVSIERGGMRCDIELKNYQGCIDISDQFTTPVNAGVSEEHQVECANQFHMRWNLPASIQYRIECHISLYSN
ncbi:MAG: DUF4962 domain-containing protein [Planctomycetes bacterium]|nr:DUF4962 domain-containing protein [Planctomycetota bacterium]